MNAATPKDLIALAPLRAADWPSVEKVYREGIATGHATFETAVPSYPDWDNRHLPFARLVARESDQILGWAALSPASARVVYAGVAEVSVYVAKSARGRGVGKRLLQALIEESEKKGLWTLQAGIFPENTSSLALHKACGFREVGRRHKIAMLHGVWRDTLLLERRSQSVGL